jgi:uroporphyrin-III C-methyltransferase
MPDLIAPGEVWLVGAGPGDPDLLTRKAERLIRAADIVFYDALVGPGVVALIPDGCEKISVGKRSGRHSQSQSAINDLLLAAAQAGARVVRLKGGDPGIFGRAGEEIDHLVAHGITVRICPGITAANAAAAAASVSLTMRGSTRAVTFVTARARAGEPLGSRLGASRRSRHDVRGVHGQGPRSVGVGAADRGGVTGRNPNDCGRERQSSQRAHRLDAPRPS